MKQEKIILSSQAVELAETQTYIELTNRVTFYDAPNLNKILLPSEGAEERAATLVNMPVVAKYRKNAMGLPDLGGHECYKDPVTGEVMFGTENVGTHISVEIKDDEVEVNGEIKTLPCLFAKSRIWARNKNVVSAVKRLFAENKLFNSWELLFSSYTFTDGIKTLIDYVFEANCLLGSGHVPAGGASAAAIELASMDEAQMMVAEALEADLVNTLNEEEEMKNVNDNTPAKEMVAEQEKLTVQTETPVAKTEVAALTEWDLRDRIREACKTKLGAGCWIAYHFPIDRTIWVEVDGRKSELDYVLFTYEVDASDVVTLSEPTPVTLAVSVREMNTVIASKDDALVKANGRINELTAEVTSLRPYKEAAELAEQERIEAETKAKRAAFAEQMKKTNLFTAEELEKDGSILAMIENLDETAMKREVAERFMKTLEATSVASVGIETAEVKEQVNLNTEPEVSTSEYMRSFLGR